MTKPNRMEPEGATTPGAGVGPVLVAIDFSPISIEVVRWAARAASAFGVGLRLLHVVHDPESRPGFYARLARRGGRDVRSLEEAAAAMMDEFVRSAEASIPELVGLRREVELVSGLPVTRILEVAARRRAQLIVVGSRGRRGVLHLLVGSRAERLVQLAPIPVTVVKGPSIR